MNLKAILKRIEARLKEKGISADAAAKAAGKPDAIRNMRRAIKQGRRGVSTETVNALAAVLDIAPELLLAEPQVSSFRATKAGLRNEARYGEIMSEMAIVPEMDIAAGAGYSGGLNQEETVLDEHGNRISTDAIRTSWGIPVPFLRDELRIAGGRAHILPVKGDSMNDALFDGDRVIVNLDDRDISQGGIFALLDDGASLIVKQVEIVRGSGGKRIRCTHRNPAYTPFELDLASPVKIIGRVASKITRLL